MYCTRCGAQIEDTARYCPRCGNPVNGEPTIAPPPGYTGPRRRLRRVRQEGKIAGVCAGFAEYFDVDVTVMRLVWVALALLPPSVGLIGYIVAWIAMPSS